MLTLVAILVDGIVYASWLFVIAIGLTLIYGVMNILNVAHGSLYALGAYSSAWLVGKYFLYDLPVFGSYLVILLAALFIGVVVGGIIERGLLRYMYDRDEVVMVLLTYAVFLILEDVMKLIWGVESYMPYQPRYLLGNISLMGLPFVIYDLCLISLALVVGISVWLGLNKTRPGKLLVAVIHDREMAVTIGINVGRVFTVTFIIGAILGALGGAFTAPLISVSPGIGVEIIVLAFAVVVIGGLGSIEGAAVGAIIVGLGRASAVHLLPQAELFIVFAVMTLVLLIRPHGLFGRQTLRKI